MRIGKIAYRNVGVNIPDLFERFLRGDDEGATRALSDAKAAGVHLVRFWGTTWGPEGFRAYEQSPARWFAAFDRMLAAADYADIALVPSLLFNIRMLAEYVGHDGGTPDTLAQYLTAGSRSNRLAVAYVTAMARRYKDDPRILFWEVGNEYNLEADLSTQINARPPGDVVTSDQIRAFLVQMATLLHAIDHNHYVTSGNDDMRPASYHLRAAMLAGRAHAHPLDFAPDWTQDNYQQYTEILAYLNPPPLDIISVHQYPSEADTAMQNKGMGWLVDDGVHAFRLPWTQYASEVMKRPLFIGEVGQKLYRDGKEQEAPWLSDFMRRLQTSEAPLSALWSWEFDPTNPDQSPLSMSPQRTPKMVLALATANTALADSAFRGVPVVRSPDVDLARTSEQAEKLRSLADSVHRLAVDVLKGAASKIDGLPVHLADATGTTNALVVRDAALMLGSDLIGKEEIAGWVKLIAAGQVGPETLIFANNLTVPPYSIPDRITAGGSPVYFPGGEPGTDQGKGDVGELPPADNPFFFIQIVYEQFRSSGSTSLFQSRVKTTYGTATVAEVCHRAFDSVPADGNGLVLIGGNSHESRADWGFADTVRKTGACLAPSVLRWQAAQDLILLCAAVGDRAGLDRYTREATTIRAGIAKTFYRSLGTESGKEVGMLISATGEGNGRRDDLWASAYAVSCGALRTHQAEAVAQHLLAVYQAGGTVQEGYIRPLPSSDRGDRYWDKTATAPDTYQNGAYWGFPTGWYVNALFTVDRSAAVRMLNEFVNGVDVHRKEGAPWQCLYPTKNYTHLADYCASVAAPAVALQSLRR